MSVQHKSLRDEILFVIGRNSEPLDSGQIYERCDLADEIKRVSDALWVLRNEGKIAFAEGDGRKRYRLADGIVAPAPAGKVGRPAAAPLTGVRPALEIPTLGDPGISLNGTAGKTQRAKPEKPKSDHIADAGKVIAPDHIADADKMVCLPDQAASAERMADGMLAKARAQLSAQIEAAPVRWWIDQDFNLEISDGSDETVILSWPDAQRLARMLNVMASVTA